MNPQTIPQTCPECFETVPATGGLARRDFLRTIGVAGGAALLPSLASAASADKPRAAKPAETLVRELFATLTPEQRAAVVRPWDHGTEKGGTATRLKTFNAPPLGKKLGELFTNAQQDLILQTFKAILSSDEAYERITRKGTWDNAGSFAGNGIGIFGDPTGKAPFSWVFGGHHLTLRCDGNSQPNTAFGGPMYYGHSANGHSENNVYNYQTRQVMGVFDMLDEKQRKQAVIVGAPGDGEAALKTKLVAQPPTGVAFTDLEAAQRSLVLGVMRTLIGPFRQEDGDEVMQLIQRNGGMEKVRLAFYKDTADKGNDRWDAWRLEGPGFVWNYRVLPHVHCFVNVVGQA